MDSWGQVGPQKPDFDADVEAIGAHLRAGRSVEVAHADRDTRTVLVLAPLAAIVDYGDRWPVHRSGRSVVILVAAIGKGADWLAIRGDVHGVDVSKYLGVANEADAAAIADFLNRLALPLLGEPARTADGTTESLATYQADSR